MTTLNNTIYGTATQANHGIPGSVLIQMGTRALSIGRDVRKRYYQTNPVIGIYPGIDKGHLEVLLFRRWVVVLSKAL